MNILPDDEQAGSPVSLGPDSQRPASLDVASAWRDTVPVFNFNHTGEPACKTEPSSTCHDGGDSAHLESALNHRTSSTGAGSIRNVEQLLHEIGAGIDSQDFHLQFSDIPSMPIYGNSLEQALRDATKRSPRDNGNKFIPIGNFDGIITKENVRREIQSWLPEDRNLEIWTKAVWDTFSYSDPVTKRNAFTSRKKIFAILVLFNAQARIASFIRGGLWDKDLPFEQTNENRWVSRPNGISGKACTIESLNWLKGLDADNFDIYQWHMLPPIFNMAEDKVIFYDLHPRIPLPFTDLESGQNRDLVGGQGEVFRVKIDESHYILDKSAKDQPKDFAIKALISTNKEQFDSEVESLKRFSNSGHPHLIKLFATYLHGTRLDGNRHYHLIFPWADGNLRHFWERHPKPSHDYELLLWIAAQCRGIAEGLRMIHNNEFENASLKPSEVKRGRHGDIKPENILWFKNSANMEQPGNGVLKISDFGLTRWHREVSSNQTDGGGVFVSKTYRAPEYDLKKSPSQSWDIWALACLYLEFLTWYLNGWENGVDEFSKQRAAESSSLSREDAYAIKEDHFFNLTKGSESKYEASLKCLVISWINKLHGTEGCSKFIHDFLDLISDHMLRIRPDNRHESKDIASRLDILYEQCKRDKFYCHKSARGQRKKKTNDSDRQELHDTASMDYSEEMTKQLCQTISADNTKGRKNDYHDQIAETEVTSSAQNSLPSCDTQHDPGANNSDGSILDGTQTESPLHNSPAPLIPGTASHVATINQPEESERQTLSDNHQNLQAPPSNKSQSSTGYMPDLLAAGEIRSSPKVTPDNSILLSSNDKTRRGTSSEQSRGSSQETRHDEASGIVGHSRQHPIPREEARVGDINVEQPTPKERRGWKRLSRVLLLVLCCGWGK